MQTQQVRNAYLETQVNTATPQKLRLMLITGAIRFARQTEAHWKAEDIEAAYESLVRSREIVSELLSTIEPSAGELPKTMAAIYVFVFRTLTEAQMHRDPEKLNEAIGVLEEEQQTWTEVCEQYPDGPAPALAGKKEEITEASHILEQETENPPEVEPDQGGFSMEA